MSSAGTDLPVSSGADIREPITRRVFRLWPLFPILIYLAVVFVVPVLQLLALSVRGEGGGFSLGEYVQLFSRPLYFRVLLITFDISFWTTALCLLGGYPIAYLLARSPENVKNLLIIGVLMPFWTGFLVRTFAWIVLLGQQGPINRALLEAGLIHQPVNLIYNFTGVMIGMVQALMPLAILTMMPVMEGIDNNLVKAATTLGAKREQAFWRVYFPLSFPGVGAAALLVFITSLGFFITPALLGGARQTMIAQVIITEVQEMLNWRLAGAVSVLLLVIVVVAFVAYDRLLGMSSLTGGSGGDTAAGRGGKEDGWVRRQGIRSGALLIEAVCWLNGMVGDALRAVSRALSVRQKAGGRLPTAALWAVVLLGVSFLALPAFFVIPVSFTSGSFLQFPPKGFSLRWYETYFGSPIWMTATVRSLIVALVTGMVSVVLGTMGALVLARQRFRGKSGVLAMILSPLILPRIVTAVALFYVFARMHLVGTSSGLVLGHTVLALPYVVITVMAVLRTYDRRLDHAAWSLGANRLQALRYVTLPLIKSGLIAAFVFAFITSFDELTIALFVSGGIATTLPKQMWTSVILQVNPTLAAVASVMLGVISFVLLGGEVLRRRTKRPLFSKP